MKATIATAMAMTETADTQASEIVQSAKGVFTILRYIFIASTLFGRLHISATVQQIEAPHVAY